MHVCVRSRFWSEATFKSLFEFVASRLSVREAQARGSNGAVEPLTFHITHFHTPFIPCVSLAPLPRLRLFSARRQDKMQHAFPLLCGSFGLQRGFFFFPYERRNPSAVTCVCCILESTELILNLFFQLSCTTFNTFSGTI